MKNNITNRQLFFILILTLTSFSVVNISKIMAENAGTGSWLTIIITAVFFSFVAVIIVQLNNLHKDKIIYEYSQDLLGKFPSYIIALFYFIYFYMIVVFLALELSVIMKDNFLHKTPIWATILIGIPVFCYIAYKGINTVGRMAEYFGVTYIITAVTVHIIMITQGKVERILPIFNSADVDNYFSAIKYAVFPFLGIEVLLFFPFDKQNGKKSVKTAFFTIITIGLFYMLVVMSSIMKLGLNNIVHYKDALIVAIRDMELPMLDILKRLDALFLTVGFVGFFMGISIVYTVLTELLCKLFVNAKRGIIVVILAISSYITCLLVINIFSDFSKFIETVGTILGLIAAVIIPTILLILSKVKNYEA